MLDFVHLCKGDIPILGRGGLLPSQKKGHSEREVVTGQGYAGVLLACRQRLLLFPHRKLVEEPEGDSKCLPSPFVLAFPWDLVDSGGQSF